MLNKFILYFFIVFQLLTTQSYAFGIIRDAEIENILSNIAEKIAKHSNLPGTIRIYIVNDESVNAFTPGGNQLFINTGMLKKSRSADMIAAVIAHEIGHMQAGHNITRRHYKEDISIISAMGMLVSIGSMALLPTNEGVFVGTLTGMEAANKSILKFSREQEIAADIASNKMLKASEFGNSGAVKILELLKKHDKIYKNDYLLSHPFTSERIKIFKNELVNSKQPDSIDFAYKMARAKLMAYTAQNKGRDNLMAIKNSTEISDTYEKAIILFRNNRFEESLKLTDTLINIEPKYAYLHELKSLILFEMKHYENAIQSMDKAINLSKNPDLLKIQQALYIISLDENRQKADINKAISILNSIQNEEDVYFKHHLLARIYGSQNKNALAQYHLAEMNYLEGNHKKALLHANKSKDYGKLPHNLDSRLNDIISLSKR